MLTFTEGAALIILIAPKRANAAGAALLLDRTLFAASDAMEEGKRIMIDLTLKNSYCWNKIGYEYFGSVLISIQFLECLVHRTFWILCQTKKLMVKDEPHSLSAC